MIFHLARVSLPPVPARVLVVLTSAVTRVVMTSAGRSQNVLTRECVTESVPSVLPLSQKPTSPPAMEIPKSASMGSVAQDFTPGRSGCYSSFLFIPVRV